MYDPERHHRRSVRLREVSYAEPAGYFVTVCTYERACLFGEVVEGEVRLSALGEIVREEWERTGAVRPYVELGAFVVMPNHVHGIIGVVGDGARFKDIAGDHGRRGVRSQTATADDKAFNISPHGRGVRPHAPTERSFVGTVPASLGAIVGNFKAMVTKRINEVRGTPGAPVWQRNYYEHIIRNGRDLERIRRYIAENPGRWGEDRYYEGELPLI